MCVKCFAYMFVYTHICSAWYLQRPEPLLGVRSPNWSYKQLWVLAIKVRSTKGGQMLLTFETFPAPKVSTF